jgi:outer membrane immunogenic protein
MKIWPTKPGSEAGVSGALHSPFKCNPNRENRPPSTRWLTPRRAEVVHVCISSDCAARAADKFEEISMKQILAGMVVAAALSGSAFATDLPLPTYTKAPAFTKAPATADPTYNWSGWYGGLNAGWVGGPGSVSNNASIVSTSDFPDNAQAMARGATNTTTGASSGFIGGGQFGYDYQFSRSFVAGFEADIQGLTGAHKGSSSAVGTVLAPTDGPTQFAPVVTNSTNSHGLSYLGTLRARVGVLVAPSFLLYATGGLAYGGARSDTTIVQSIDDPPLATLMTSGSFSKTRVGYAVGAGGEWMLSSNWSAKLEYLYYDLGSVTYATGGLASDIGAVLLPGSSTGVAAVATSSQVRFKDNIVRVGLNYHFGGPAVSQY